MFRWIALGFSCFIVFTPNPAERQLAKLQNGVDDLADDLGTSQDLILAGQKGLGERVLDFGGVCLGTWLINLPQNLCFSGCLLVIIWFYTWFKRSLWSDSFYVDLFLKSLLAFLYPIRFLYLIVSGLRDIHNFREIRTRPPAPRIAETVNVSLIFYRVYFRIDFLHSFFFPVASQTLDSILDRFRHSRE